MDEQRWFETILIVYVFPKPWAVFSSSQEARQEKHVYTKTNCHSLDQWRSVLCSPCAPKEEASFGNFSLAFLNFAKYLEKVKAVRSKLHFIIFGHLQKGYSGKACFPFGISILLISAAMNTPEDLLGSMDGKVTKSCLPMLLLFSAAKELESKDSHTLIILTCPGVQLFTSFPRITYKVRISLSDTLSFFLSDVRSDKANMPAGITEDIILVGFSPSTFNIF